MKIFIICLAVILLTSGQHGVASTIAPDTTSETIVPTMETTADPYAPEPRVCPDGFVNLEDSCYFFSANSLSWFNAMKTCINMEANLASLETLQEIELVKEHVRTIDPLRQYDWWLSASDDSQEGVFVWVNTMELVDITDWCPNDPNNYYDESCVQMVASCDYRWQERSCDYSYSTRYICEV